MHLKLEESTFVEFALFGVTEKRNRKLLFGVNLLQYRLHIPEAERHIAENASGAVGIKGRSVEEFLLGKQSWF
eukprot:2641457-Amphidinium_carterae.1